MQYIRVAFNIPEEFTDILIAELAEEGFDSFSGEGSELEGYISEDLFAESKILSVTEKYKDLFPVDFTWSKLEQKNWNEEWEKNFSPVRIVDKCLIRASFHESDPALPYEIVINPKMSFGTGHHETTSLMAENQLLTDHKGKRVMDAGSGTGILAILAEKLGATEILAFDIEEWAYNNMIENAEINNCRKIDIKRGTIDEIKPQGLFDIVLANINKNVLMEEIPAYSKVLKTGGKLLLSGFYTQDIADLTVVAAGSALKTEKESSKNNWVCLVLTKL
jgi:ribosomal protein L11 methyltransferase